MYVTRKPAIIAVRLNLILHRYIRYSLYNVNVARRATVLIQTGAVFTYCKLPKVYETDNNIVEYACTYNK